jgi:hypothetical protein
VSLALNAFLIYNLGRVRSVARAGIDSALEAVDSLAEGGFHYEYRFEDVLPFSADVPFEQEMVFPFNEGFPISTTVDVPIDTGFLGEFVFSMPVSTVVQIDTAVPIQISETFQVSTSVPISVIIPIDIGAEDPEAREVLGQIREWLLRLRNSF